MSGDLRIRIRTGSGELELEGTSEFIAGYAEPIGELLQSLVATPSVPSPSTNSSGGPSTQPPAPTSGQDGALPEFGEIFQQIPSSASATDQILVAGWYVQQKSANDSFTTREANALLLGQAVKIANPSQSIKNNVNLKRVFKVGANGFRISVNGKQHVQSLVSLK